MIARHIGKKNSGLIVKEAVVVKCEIVASAGEGIVMQANTVVPEGALNRCDPCTVFCGQRNVPTDEFAILHIHCGSGQQSSTAAVSLKPNAGHGGENGLLGQNGNSSRKGGFILTFQTAIEIDGAVFDGQAAEIRPATGSSAFATD